MKHTVGVILYNQNINLILLTDMKVKTKPVKINKVTSRL
jgi:hypothetical protein